MSRKIIIITRECGVYEGDEDLVRKMPQKGKRGTMSSGCFCGFMSLYNSKELYDKNNVVSLNNLIDILYKLKFPTDKIDDNLRAWFNGKVEPLSLSIDERLVEVLNKIAKAEGKERLYMDKIELDNNDEVYLFYWDKYKITLTDTWRILSLICKDCGIDFSTEGTEENILYIHDGEWGAKGNKILVFNHDIKSEENYELLVQLTKKFSFVAYFQHIKEPGTLFWDILHCNFGNNMLSTLLGEKEKDSTTFGYLRKACIDVLETKK